MTLNSTDTADNPLVNPAWLSTREDQELAVAAFKRARQVADATGIMVGEEVVPGPGVRTDAQILEYIRGSLASIHHAVATCMFPPFFPFPPCWQLYNCSSCGLLTCDFVTTRRDG